MPKIPDCAIAGEGFNVYGFNDASLFPEQLKCTCWSPYEVFETRTKTVLGGKSS
jgi:hypothetical protein